MSSFVDRLREVIRPLPASAGLPPEPPAAPGADGHRAHVPARENESADGLTHRAGAADAAGILDGDWQERRGQRFVVVDSRYLPGHRHGHVAVADGLPPPDGMWAGLPILAGTSCRGRMLFVDLETTGLAGGAGSYAFLVGCGWFDAGVFRVRQFFLSSFAGERGLLEAVADTASEVGALVTYNGKSFDVPLMETRFSLHRLDTPFAGLPHVDMLHHARRLWRQAGSVEAYARDVAGRHQFRSQEEPGRVASGYTESGYAESGYAASGYAEPGCAASALNRTSPREVSGNAESAFSRTSRFAYGSGGHGAGADTFGRRGAGSGDCRLSTLEDVLCGHRREGDVAGFEIPSRYFHYVRSGDPRGLAPVLEHNRLDLLALALVTARAAQLLEEGPALAGSAREAFGMGRLYERAGLEAEAGAAFDWAASLAGTDDVTCAEALRAGAQLLRRRRRHEDAAAAWRRIIDLRGAPPSITREAIEALAVHHEHRLCDPQSARGFALRSMTLSQTAARREAAQHRLARLNRKIGEPPNPTLFTSI